MYVYEEASVRCFATDQGSRPCELFGRTGEVLKENLQYQKTDVLVVLR